MGGGCGGGGGLGRQTAMPLNLFGTGSDKGSTGTDVGIPSLSPLVPRNTSQSFTPAHVFNDLGNTSRLHMYTQIIVSDKYSKYCPVCCRQTVCERTC